MSILSTTNTGLHGPVTEEFLLSLGLEKQKYDTILGIEKFAFYNKDILPMTFRITFHDIHEKNNPEFYGVIGDRSVLLKSKEKVLLYLNYAKMIRELQSHSFTTAEKISELVNERLKFYNEIIK